MKYLITVEVESPNGPGETLNDFSEGLKDSAAQYHMEVGNLKLAAGVTEQETPDDPNTEETATCAYCGHTGPASLFEPINHNGNAVACRAVAACAIRQTGGDPVYELGRLLRAVHTELGTLTSGQLANLAVDADGFERGLLFLLSAHPDGWQQLDAVRRDRSERARRRQELLGAEAHRERQPVDPELFARTAPRWNCVDFPADGPHYLSAGPVPPRGSCRWCGKSAEEIKRGEPRAATIEGDIKYHAELRNNDRQRQQRKSK